MTCTEIKTFLVSQQVCTPTKVIHIIQINFRFASHQSVIFYIVTIKIIQKIGHVNCFVCTILFKVIDLFDCFINVTVNPGYSKPERIY